MADSDDVASARDNIKQGEIKFGASISEATMTKISGGINFVNNRQVQVHVFNFHGPLRTLSGGEDGKIIFPSDYEILAVCCYIRNSGTSGSTTIDFHRERSSDGDKGSICTQKLVITSNEDVYPKGKNYVDGTESDGVVNGSHGFTTFPAFSSRDFNAFDALRLDIDSVAVGAKDLTINVWYRPR